MSGLGAILSPAGRVPCHSSRRRARNGSRERGESGLWTNCALLARPPRRALPRRRGRVRVAMRPAANESFTTPHVGNTRRAPHGASIVHGPPRGGRTPEPRTSSSEAPRPGPFPRVGDLETEATSWVSAFPRGGPRPNGAAEEPRGRSRPRRPREPEGPGEESRPGPTNRVEGRPRGPVRRSCAGGRGHVPIQGRARAPQIAIATGLPRS